MLSDEADLVTFTIQLPINNGIPSGDVYRLSIYGSKHYSIRHFHTAHIPFEKPFFLPYNNKFITYWFCISRGIINIIKSNLQTLTINFPSPYEITTKRIARNQKNRQCNNNQYFFHGFNLLCFVVQF
jgi:hypothetical protein